MRRAGKIDRGGLSIACSYISSCYIESCIRHRPLLSQHFLHHYTPSVVIPSLYITTRLPSLKHSSLLTFAPLCSSSTSISVCPLFLAKSKAVRPLCTAHKDELSKGCVRVGVRLVYTWICRVSLHMDFQGGVSSRAVFHTCPAHKDALSKGLATRGCDTLTCCAYTSKPISIFFVYKYIQIYMSFVRPYGLTGILEQVYINTYMYTYHINTCMYT